MPKNEPNPHQRRILEDDSRIRVVRAVPGSGKTWLIGRKIREVMEVWPHSHRGLAALSFTNVGRDEIQEALGFIPSHPHFVGTLDSFVFRYVIRPFGYLYDPGLQDPVLVPASYAETLVGKQQWARRSDILVNVSDELRAGIFLINFAGDENGRPTFKAKTTSKRHGTIDVEGKYYENILRMKRELWRRGRVSHSDTGFIARELVFGVHQDQILQQLTRRFPVLIVDELQDTGLHMGQFLQRVLSRQDTKALLVGDPNQAIFEFSGATPDLFSRFEELPGARRLEMNHSRRCPLKVRKAAEALAVDPCAIEGEEATGAAVLASFSGDGVSSLRSFCERCTRKGLSFSILVRKASHGSRLNPHLKLSSRAFRSQPLQSLYNAVAELRGNRPSRAVALADSALSRVAFGTNHMPIKELRQAGIDPFNWRKAVVSILLEAYRQVPGEDSYGWGLRQKSNMLRILAESAWPKYRAPNNPSKDLIDKPLWRDAMKHVDTELPWSTIHGAKGQTLDTTILFVPKVKEEDCPSSQWWDGSEEQRVAYVAATRARRAFILCVHKDVLARLEKRQPEFVAAFEVRKLVDMQPSW